MAGAANGLASLSVWANAQSSAWPQRPIKWIVSQPAGAGPDLLARYLGEQMSKLWGQPVVIENRPGGQNVIGAQAAARSAPDGYTFFYATTAAMVTNVHTFKALPYDPAKDFVPVRLVGRSAFVLATGGTSTIRSLAELIPQAKAQPGAITVATEGPKTFSGMLADKVASLADMKLNHVPYTKASEAIQDTITNRVNLICLPEAALKTMIRSGQIRALAVSGPQRAPDMPSVPTLAESFNGFEYTGWNGVFAPTGTPADLLLKINRDLETVVRQPEVSQRMASMGSQVEERMDLNGFDQFMRAERQRWATLVKALNIQAE
jgi:tripartite-type tricarboxylate transporter receptor subunit TctC